jgi:DNA processing protein
MIHKLSDNIPALNSMKSYPEDIFYIGNTLLLRNKKISIVGTRKPISYTKIMPHALSSKLSDAGVTIVSGAAMGVDAISHNAAINNTIAVMANSLDIKYPSVNKNLIENIENKSLVLSTYPSPSKPRAYTFVQRNELVVALGDILIITQADLNSGSLRSAQFAIQMGKEIFVLAHRIGESKGTDELVAKGFAKVIYDIDDFISSLGLAKQKSKDDFMLYCQNNPKYDDAILNYKEKVFEYELLGKITIKNGVILIN